MVKAADAAVAVVAAEIAPKDNAMTTTTRSQRRHPAAAPRLLASRAKRENRGSRENPGASVNTVTRARRSCHVRVSAWKARSRVTQ